MSKFISYFIASLVLILIVVPLLAYGVFSWGVVLYYMWHWFVLSVFPSLPFINIYQAIGLSLFTMVFKNHASSEINIKEEYKEKNKYSWVSLLTPWFALLIAYAYKAIFM